MTHSKFTCHDVAVISCPCTLGAGGLLDGVLHIVVHLHGILDTHRKAEYDMMFNKRMGGTMFDQVVGRRAGDV